jgi:Short C-terminal domain/Phospholipase_D-nuclease N-terminal
MTAALLGATSYPLLDAFLTVLWIVGFVLWIWLMIAVFSDIFRSRDLSGWGKAAWILLIFILPLLGVLIYLIARGHKMHEHAASDMKAQDEAFRRYVQEAAATSGNGSSGTADQLSKLADLRDRGVITPEEFDREKAKVLS